MLLEPGMELVCVLPRRNLSHRALPEERTEHRGLLTALATIRFSLKGVSRRRA